MKRNTNFLKSWALVIAAIFISLNIVAPIAQSLTIKNEDNKQKDLGGKDFSITIHRIREEDDIDPWPHGEADWTIRMYVNNAMIEYNCPDDHNDLLVDKTFVWAGVNPNNGYVSIRMELFDRDPWPDVNDIADISTYTGGGPDNSMNFPRGAVFIQNYSVNTMQWKPVDNNNDYLTTDGQSPFIWYVTSGNYDGSTTWDENDATVWFNVSFGNSPPYPPEKPNGPASGWQGMIYDFSTSSSDPNGDKIQYGWDWDGLGDVDELTGFYNSWETVTSSHVWTQGQLYYVKVIAIDSRGMQSEWSEPLKVRINAEGGINGVEVEEWSLGHIYCIYYNHEKTQEMLDILRQGGDVVAAIAAVITAIAAACGVPVPYVFVFPIVAALLRLGAEVIGLLDRGMGIYIKTYVVEVYGWPECAFAYIWSQTAEGCEGAPPVDNQAPLKPEKPSGPRHIIPGREYSFKSVTTDPNDDNVTYIFDWDDGNFSCSDLVYPGNKITMSHTWEKSGTYNIRVKVLDEYGFESEWSDPFTVKVLRSRSISGVLAGGYLMDLLQHFKIIKYLGQILK